MKQFGIYLIVASIGLLSACGGDNTRPQRDCDELAQCKPEPVTRLDSLVLTSAPVDTSDAGMRLWYAVMAPSSSMDLWIKGLPHQPMMQVFGRDAMTKIRRVDTLASTLGVIRHRMARKTPAVSWRPIYTVVTPYNQSIILGDSAMLISLSRYLGSDYEGYHSFPGYMTRLYDPGRIPYDVAEALLRTAYQRQEGSNALGAMLYEGAIVEALLEIVPDSEPSDALGITQEDSAELATREEELWRDLVASQQLFTTNDFDIARLNEHSPYYQLGQSRYPERAGAYIGWRIMRQYRDGHKRASLDTILRPRWLATQGQTIIKESGYNGRRP